MKIKVCGMRQAENIIDLVGLQPDYIGFIFYQKSKRLVKEVSSEILNQIPPSIKRTGVFVDAGESEIEEKIHAFGLHSVQLHGSETASFCNGIKNKGVELIKAFGIDEFFDFSILEEYADADYFLFDTKSSSYGGTGNAFDWEILTKYKLNKPYFLSGGLSLENLPAVKQLQDNRLFAVDLNSRFETEPGLKDIKKLRQAIRILRN